ncbi:MAG: hypothetical protein JSV92_01880 [archaeon]|nr:MAG: hypothetical protein JSV92_01880 [archaeon]
MKTICERMALQIVPAIRALVARDLIEAYNMTQKEAAKKLEMTQPGISQYKKHLRGVRTKILESDSEISKNISRISSSLAKNEMKSAEASSEICGICKYIRKRGLVKKIV